MLCFVSVPPSLWFIPETDARTLLRRAAAGRTVLTRAGRTRRSWRRWRRCGSHQRFLGSSCLWARSSCSWWRAHSLEAYPQGWRNRHQGRTAWWMGRNLSQRWRNVLLCHSSWAACGHLKWRSRNAFIIVTQWLQTPCSVSGGRLGQRTLTWHLDEWWRSGWSSLQKQRHSRFYLYMNYGVPPILVFFVENGSCGLAVNTVTATLLS